METFVFDTLNNSLHQSIIDAHNANVRAFRARRVRRTIVKTVRIAAVAGVAIAVYNKINDK